MKTNELDELQDTICDLQQEIEFYTLCDDAGQHIDALRRFVRALRLALDDFTREAHDDFIRQIANSKGGDQ